MPCIQTPLRSLQISSTSPALRTTAESPLSAAAPRVSCPHTRGHRTNTKRAQLRSRRRAARSPSAHLQAALCLPDPLLTPSRSPAQHAPPATATSVPLPPRGVSRPGRPNREPAAPGAARPPLQHRRRPPSVIRREGRRGRTGGAALPWGSLLQPEVPADAAAPEVLPGRPNRVPPPLPRGTAAPSRAHLPARASRSRTATAAPRSARSPSAAAAPRPRPGCRPWAALGGTPLLPAGDARGRAGRDNRSRPRSPSGRLGAPRLSRRRSAGSAQLTRSHQTAPAALQEKPSALPAPPPPRSLPFLRRRFLPRSAPARSGHRPAAEGVPGTGSTPPPPCLLPRGWAALAGAPRTSHQGSDPRH